MYRCSSSFEKSVSFLMTPEAPLACSRWTSRMWRAMLKSVMSLPCVRTGDRN